MQTLTLLDIGPQESKLIWPWKMFLCKNCCSNIPANQASFNFTIQTRSKTYPKRNKANVYIDLKGKEQVKADPGGVGTEIVKEIQVCQSCFTLLQQNE
jgi:hypothetical protein